MKPITPFVFRGLVILSAVLALGAGLLNPIFLPKLPIGHSELLFPRSTPLFVALALPRLLLDIASTVGLCMFWRWSRPASIVCIVLALPLYAMSAYFVDSGIKVAVEWLATFLGGAVLSMAYFSPIAYRFESASPAPGDDLLSHP